MGKEIVQKVWNYCNVLRDDGMSYGDYVEQLTYLLFLKMDDEQSKPPINKPSSIPEKFQWKNLINKDGIDLEMQYRNTIEALSKKQGILGVIFRKSQNKIQDPAKLKRLLSLIDRETWIGLDIDVKGEIYEGLLQKNAEDTKSGAGQYFTPRSLIKAIVEVMQPKLGETICDPACGTGGFFICTHDYLKNNFKMNPRQREKLRSNTFKGWEIESNTARLCMMNLFLHGIGEKESPIMVEDSLIKDPGDKFNVVMTNPPFGKKSSITITNEEGKSDKHSLTYEREDFWATTSNKQLNFLQHVKTILEINGRAAVVLPDNVLFEGGAGETIRKKMMDELELHTILRLPTGIFYAQGVKANVLFFDKKPASEKHWTENVWIYDFRTNIHFTLKNNQLSIETLKDFVTCYNAKNRHDRKETERFKCFTYDEILKRDKINLDIFWLKDNNLTNMENLLEPDEIALEIRENLEMVFGQFREISEELEK